MKDYVSTLWKSSVNSRKNTENLFYSPEWYEMQIAQQQ